VLTSNQNSQEKYVDPREAKEGGNFRGIIFTKKGNGEEETGDGDGNILCLEDYKYNIGVM